MDWNINDKTNRYTVLYGDPGVEYFYKDQPSSKVYSWSGELLEIKERVEKTYQELARCEKRVRFNVCLVSPLLFDHLTSPNLG